METEDASLDRPAGDRGKFLQEAIVELSGYRQLVRGLERLNRRAGVGIGNTGRLHLTIAEIGERLLHRL